VEEALCLAAGVSAVAFALVHPVQGWRSVILIVVFGLVVQGFFVLTGTLVLAMVVHAAPDLIAGHLIGVEAKRQDASG
jgi:membrane protease YdiL (CAAX protease family)